MPRAKRAKKGGARGAKRPADAPALDEDTKELIMQCFATELFETKYCDDLESGGLPLPEPNWIGWTRVAEKMALGEEGESLARKVVAAGLPDAEAEAKEKAIEAEAEAIEDDFVPLEQIDEYEIEIAGKRETKDGLVEYNIRFVNEVEDEDIWCTAADMGQVYGKKVAAYEAEIAKSQAEAEAKAKGKAKGKRKVEIDSGFTYAGLVSKDKAMRNSVNGSGSVRKREVQEDSADSQLPEAALKSPMFYKTIALDANLHSPDSDKDRYQEPQKQQRRKGKKAAKAEETGNKSGRRWAEAEVESVALEDQNTIQVTFTFKDGSIATMTHEDMVHKGIHQHVMFKVLEAYKAKMLHLRNMSVSLFR